MDSCGFEWSLPTFVSQPKTLKAKNIYHPLINNCVPNSIQIDKSVIITGSNMSGKSSFLRTLAVNIVSSYALNMSFSSEFSLPECRLHSVLSVSDNLDEGKSYYMSEVLRIQSIIDRCSSADNHVTDFVFIDEIFKGTNTVERISIADAVIRYLSSLENTTAVVSTHDIELASGQLVGTYAAIQVVHAKAAAAFKPGYSTIPGQCDYKIIHDGEVIISALIDLKLQIMHITEAMNSRDHVGLTVPLRFYGRSADLINTLLENLLKQRLPGDSAQVFRRLLVVGHFAQG